MNNSYCVTVNHNCKLLPVIGCPFHGRCGLANKTCADPSQAPGLCSCFKRSMNVHFVFIKFVPQWWCIWSPYNTYCLVPVWATDCFFVTAIQCCNQVHIIRGPEDFDFTTVIHAITIFITTHFDFLWFDWSEKSKWDFFFNLTCYACNRSNHIYNSSKI